MKEKIKIMKYKLYLKQQDYKKEYNIQKKMYKN